MNKLILFLLPFLILACGQKPSQTESEPTPVSYNMSITDIQKPKTKPKNVILMVGDGMGISQITAGIYSSSQKLNLESFPIVGLHKSHASNDLITDSAAGATAFACGVKTYNGAIGVGPDSVAVETILEKAEKKGMATGLVATSTIVHATPASFIAHQPSRKMYEEIAADFLKTDIDFFIGGGKKFFDRRESDERNLYEELEKKGYYITDYFNEDLKDVKIPMKKKFGYLTSDKDPLPVAQGRTYLKTASNMAINYLNRKSTEGFFLMIEGSQIDWGGHANDANYIITEMLDFDRTIGQVLKFAQKDGETLVIVTADHETGGFSINKGSNRDSLVTAFTTDYHTADLIPVFAYGPGASNFSGIYQNTAIFDKMKRAMGL